MSKRVRPTNGVTARGRKGRTMTLRIARKILKANRRWIRGARSISNIFYSREWVRAERRLERYSENHPNWLALQCVRRQISELEYLAKCMKRDKHRKQKKPRNNGRKRNNKQWRRSWK